MTLYTTIVPVIDKSQAGHHFASKDGTIQIVKNKNASWVIYKDGVEIEMYGIADNAVEAAKKMVKG